MYNRPLTITVQCDVPLIRAHLDREYEVSDRGGKLALRKVPRLGVPDSQINCFSNFPVEKSRLLPYQREVMRHLRCDATNTQRRPCSCRPVAEKPWLGAIGNGEAEKRRKSRVSLPTQATSNQVVEQADDKYGLTVLNSLAVSKYNQSDKANTNVACSGNTYRAFQLNPFSMTRT